MKQINVLAIGGSDSCGGAGIQADIKSISAFGAHALTAITAITAQNTFTVSAVEMVSPAMLRKQAEAIFADFEIAAIKIGMLGNAESIAVVADLIKQQPRAHVVLDPVMIATSGASLLEDEAISELRNRLIPLASVITPNIPEAERLLGRSLDTEQDRNDALPELLRLGARAVVLKGGHGKDAIVTDHLICSQGQFHFTHPRLDLVSHGGGCTFASVLATRLALGDALSTACERASDFTFSCLKRSCVAGTAGIRLPVYF